MLEKDKKATPFSPTVWDREHNPFLLDWWKGHTNTDIWDANFSNSFIAEFHARDVCIKKYGFAVPTEKILRKVISASPNGILEIGAGSGYWAHLLDKLGADIRACDDDSGTYPFDVGSFFDVERISYEKLLKKESCLHERTLLMVWPSYENIEAFNRYHGSTVIYVGEIGDGCTGYDEKIEESWMMEKHVQIPVWKGIHDSMGIFKRKVVR